MPKHRATAPPISAAARALRRAALCTGVATVATGIALSSGMFPGAAPHEDMAAASLTSAATRHDIATASAIGLTDMHRRVGEASRSGERAPLKVARKATLSRASASRRTSTEDRDPRAIARALLPRFGYSQSQFSCLDALYMSESGWNIHATNPYSGAYGIPQALPPRKMASAGADWHDDAATQIKWGLRYIKLSYGSPCGAWAFKASHHWY